MKESDIIFLYERAAHILLYLVNSPSPKITSQIQKLTMVSNRTVRYDLDNIDEFLLDNNMEKLSRKPRVGIFFVGDEVDRNKVRSLLKNVGKYNYIYSPDERMVMIILEFVESMDYITVDYLAGNLQVSQSTINNDLKRVRDVLKKYELKIVFLQRHGLKLEGREKSIRKLLVDFWLEYIYNFSDVKSKAYSHGKDDKFELKKLIDKLKYDIDIPFIENIVNIMEKKVDVNYSDVSYANIVVHIAVSLLRIKQNQYIALDIVDITKIKKTKEFIIVKGFSEILEDYYSIKIIEDEIIYITTCLLGGNLSSNDENFKGNWVHVQILVKEVIKQVNSKIIMDISQDWKLFNGLLEHMKPMINRLKYGVKLENPIIHNIKEDYGDLFKIVKESVYPIEEFLDKKLNDDEIGYLTIHFGAAVERERFSGVSKPRVLIVCNTGLGTSELLSVQIQSIFEVYIVDAISKRQLKNILKSEEVDIIISTVPIENSLNIRVINVKPILTKEDIITLNSIFLKSKGKKIEIDGLINVIEKSCSINNRQQLEKDLYNIFNTNLITNRNGDDKPVLRDIITDKTIKLNVEAKDWEEAVRIGGNLLVDVKAAEERYVEAMINSVKEIGPYIVIAEGIAMPHARPEKGALDVGMSIVTLKDPIEFGNEDNDPVKLVIAFCAVDSDSHLKALSQLMVLLEDEDTIDTILNSNDVNQVIEIIDKFSN